jgi:F0F1-type ATP synthase gamma subunit
MPGDRRLTLFLSARSDELLEALRSGFHRLRQSGIDEELFDVIAGYESIAQGA